MRSTYWVGVAGILGVIAACSGGDPAPLIGGPSTSGSGGKKSTGGRTSTDGGDGDTGGTFTRAGSGGSTAKPVGGKNAGGEAGGGGEGGEADDPANAPVIEIIAPTESLAPADGVLIEQVVHVVCAVAKSSAPTADDVDPTTVRLAVRDSTGKVLVEKDATGTKNAGEYAADFVMTTVPSGQVSFLCSAADRQKVKGTDTLFTYVDHGPIITVITPKPDSANALKGGLAVEFLVDPAPLADVDPGSEVDSVAFTLDGKPFVLEYSDGKYHTSLALDNTITFPTIPAGAINVTATNKRTPAPATSILSYDIAVDGAGPVIAIQAPLPQAVVGGQVTLAFTVTDVGSAGVDPDSVNVTLYSGQTPAVRFDANKRWTRTGDKYTYTFDSKDIEQFAKVQTTLNIRASDKVGNPGASGQSVQIYLDNVPPQIDLDPLNVRTKGPQGCSGSFDPVGTASLNDLQGSIGHASLDRRFGFFRAFVKEQTNEEIGQSLFYHSGTVQTEVRLYVQPDPENATTKLLINKNPGVDSTCDDIGGVDDLENAPQFSAMKSMSATASVGTPWNQDDPGMIPLAGACTLKSDAKPKALCPTQSSDMWYAAFNKQLKEPHVYVVGTPNASDASCSGIDLAFLTVTQLEGWVCVAARVLDKAGNVGISPPLRVCVDAPETDYHPPCSNSSVEPPTCTDGCTAPNRGGGVFVDL